MTCQKYRFTRASFLPLTTKPLHFDLVFDIQSTQVQVTLQTTYHYVGKTPLTELQLNSKELNICSVEQWMEFDTLTNDFPKHVASFKQSQSREFVVDKDNHMLLVKFPSPILPNSQFVLRTVSIATPTENILEGLYFDYTPEGAPKTIITQCQQYGFQRIVPCIDTMDAKAYYTTTIVADKRYTNLITNGDLAPGFSTASGLPVYHAIEEVDGIPVAPDASRHVLKYYNHKVCMAPYLFFLGVGTYVTYRQTLEFPDGDTTLLELLTLPGRAEPEDAKKAVQMLHDSILWVMVSLGPEACQHDDEREEIYQLIAERDAIKAKMGPLITGSEESVTPVPLSSTDEARLSEIRSKLKNLLTVWTKTGYKYTGAIYREIAMENSYYGGMENVGNTTIVSSCLCPTCTMDDLSYEYMERVKVHEYYHNINGSEVTGQSPFEIWLNEAVTVHMERKRHAFLFGEDYARLSAVVYMFRPALGPLAQDKSATSLSIEPEGFNQTQELVSVVTYSKAPEFVRMVELLLGQDKFNKALDQYHTKYSFGNATTMQWIECMESSGISLQSLAKTWLKRPGYPEVAYTTSYDASKQQYVIQLTQTGFEDKPEDNNGPWDIPIDWALIKDGKVMKEGIYRFDTASAEWIIEQVDTEPDFLSFARGWSFFGKSTNTSATFDMLLKQAMTDPDAINRYFAYREIAEKEKTNVIESLLRGEIYTISPEFVHLHQLILFDKSLSPSIRALTLSEPNSTKRDDLSHHYIEINQARKALLQMVYVNHAAAIVDYYTEIQQQSIAGPHKLQLHDRTLKAFLLNLITTGSKSPVLPSIPAVCIDANPMTLAKSLYESSTFMTDRSVAVRALLGCEESPERTAMQAAIFEEWSKESNMLEKYIAIISSLDTKDVGMQIRQLVQSSVFNVNLSHHSRTIARGVSQIRHYSILTDDGLALMQELFVLIGKVNQMSAYPLLQCFDQVKAFDQDTQTKLYATLQAMQDSIDAKKEESLYNRLNIMLNKA